MNWYHQAGVTPCLTCDGHGSEWNRLWLRPGAPDCWAVDCPECEAQGHHACAVCGFDQQVAGYDCAVCDHVNSFTAEDLKAIDAAAFAQSFLQAMEVARAAESYVPAQGLAA